MGDCDDRQPGANSARNEPSSSVMPVMSAILANGPLRVMSAAPLPAEPSEHAGQRGFSIVTLAAAEKPVVLRLIHWLERATLTRRLLDRCRHQSIRLGFSEATTSWRVAGAAEVVVAGSEGFHGRKRNPLGRGAMRWLAETLPHRRAARSQPAAPTFRAPLVVVVKEGDPLAGCHLDAKISRGGTTPDAPVQTSRS
jgi:hypothetical protein